MHLAKKCEKGTAWTYIEFGFLSLDFHLSKLESNILDFSKIELEP